MPFPRQTKICCRKLPVFSKIKFWKKIVSVPFCKKGIFHELSVVFIVLWVEYNSILNVNFIVLIN